MNAEEVAFRIVQRIGRDLRDRSGLRHVWDGIDDDTQAEIVATWRDIAREEIEGASHSASVQQEG